MTNIEIAWVFWEIADLLELNNDSFYKVRAYRKAAKTIKHLRCDINELYRLGKLRNLPSIGKTIAENIAELLESGKCKIHEQLKKEVPISLRKILSIPGVGPKTIELIRKELGITTIAELKEAAKHKKLRKLPGLGSKTELNILRGIEMLEQKQLFSIPQGVALPFAKNLLNDLLSIQGVEKGSLCGSLRRAEELVQDIDLLIGTGKPELVKAALQAHPQVKDVITSGNEKNTVQTLLGLRVNVYLVQPEDYWFALNYITGPIEFFSGLQEHAKKHGYSIDKYSCYDKILKCNIAVQSEEDIYRTLKIQFIPPEIRDSSRVIETASKGKIPTLIEKSDIKGDLHIHTSWSDGVNEIEEMAQAAIEKGYKYIAITDHSKSLTIAKGLSVERLKEQHAHINKLNREYKDFQILTGVEMDILQDGRLDYPDEVLAQCDVVIASIHTGLRQEKEKIQARFEAALKNPFVDIIAHPTGRIIGRRKPYDLDFDRFFDLVKKEKKIVEMNSSPDRLDLNGENVQKAVQKYDIPIAINTDAHDIERLDDIEYGILTARRGWLSRRNVINTLELDELKKILRR
ncbi:MAG TPA: DNA polymerase/3'-5' exonuclease PolX [Clostridia bacterium]|nr:DNA polymerase/3'-5' exonuclease PolX [Clostridia bacterium]